MTFIVGGVIPRVVEAEFQDILAHRIQNLELFSIVAELACIFSGDIYPAFISQIECREVCYYEDLLSCCKDGLGGEGK